MNDTRPKALSIPRVPRRGFLLPWLQIAESNERNEKFRRSVLGGQYEQQHAVNNYAALNINPSVVNDSIRQQWLFRNE